MWQECGKIVARMWQKGGKIVAKFEPNYTITNTMANNLVEIERIKEGIKGLPINPKLLNSLRETAKITTIHYSTQIEGNRLSQEDVFNILKRPNKVISNTGRIRDEKEIRGYYVALDYIEELSKEKAPITEKQIKQIHALVEGGGSIKVNPTEYRQGQNVITDSLSGNIVYMPPEADDVPTLMKELVEWINSTEEIPIPIKAGIIHYQFVTIHPYFDGNGRTARLLTTLALHKSGYDLKGIYSLEEYYAKDLQGYYNAITIGTSHNYYLGRAEADITKWIEYFVNGMTIAFKSVYKKAKENQDSKDETRILRELNTKQRQVLNLFEEQKYVTAKDIATFFKFSPRTARLLVSEWVASGFLNYEGEGKKRRYFLNDKFENIL